MIPSGLLGETFIFSERETTESFLCEDDVIVISSGETGTK